MSFKLEFPRAFRHKNYRTYYLLQFVSFCGTWMQGTALSWLVYRLTGSPFFLGAVGFAGSIPALFLAPIAGVLADHYDRRKMLLITQGMCLLHAIIIAILFFTNKINPWHIFYLAIFLGIANALDFTARQSFVPSMFEKEDLTSAIPLNSAMFNTARMAGPAIAGYLIAYTNEGVCFFLNLISYIPIFIFFILVKTNKQIIEKSDDAIAHLKQGILFAWENKPARALLLMVGMFSFWAVSFTTFMPIFSDKILHAGSKGLGLLGAASGVGSIFGGLYLASRKRVIGINRIIGVVSIIGSIALAVFSISKIFLLSCIALAISGFCFVTIFAGSNTLLQALAPEALRGRIISLFSTMLIGMYPLGSLLSGFIAKYLGVSYTVLMGAIVCFLFGLYFNSRLPKLVRDVHDLLNEQKKAEALFKLEKTI